MNLGQEVYIGLDTHRETVHGTALDKNGDIICSYEFPNGEDALKEFLKGFPVWNTTVALEACNIWRGCYKILKQLGYKVKLANPLKCHQIAKDKKTDKIDSKILADLLRVNYLPEVYILSEEILKLRDLTRHKCNLMRMRVKVQNKIKACLLREGIQYDRKIWNKKGISWLKSLKDEKLEDFITIYELLKKREATVLKKIRFISNVKEDISLLKTIPGIGYFGATMIYAEIGDIKRFPAEKHLHAYAGVVPGIQQSGTKTRMSKRREINYWLKWIIGQCAGRVTIKKCKLQNYYFKIRNNKGWKTAKKATARKMLSIVWHVLNEKIPYNES